MMVYVYFFFLNNSDEFLKYASDTIGCGNYSGSDFSVMSMYLLNYSSSPLEKKQSRTKTDSA